MFKKLAVCAIALLTISTGSILAATKDDAKHRNWRDGRSHRPDVHRSYRNTYRIYTQPYGYYPTSRYYYEPQYYYRPYATPYSYQNPGLNFYLDF